MGHSPVNVNKNYKGKVLGNCKVFVTAMTSTKSQKEFSLILYDLHMWSFKGTVLNKFFQFLSLKHLRRKKFLFCLIFSVIAKSAKKRLTLKEFSVWFNLELNKIFFAKTWFASKMIGELCCRKILTLDKPGQKKLISLKYL